MDNGEPFTILFIEEDPVHVEITMRNLKKSRIANRLIHLSDGHEALNYLFHQGNYTDVKTSPIPQLTKALDVDKFSKMIEAFDFIGWYGTDIALAGSHN